MKKQSHQILPRNKRKLLKNDLGEDAGDGDADPDGFTTIDDGDLAQLFAEEDATAG